MAKRVETGPIEFPDDWPGVFIRGDNALYYGMELETLFELLKDHPSSTVQFHISVLRGLQATLSSCGVGTNPTTVKVKRVDG